MQYRKLRAPQSDGQSLQDPPLRDAQKLWHQNLEIDVARGRSKSFDFDLLRQVSRAECFDLAKEYTSRYLNVDFYGRNNKRFIFSGHQPTLFHPGVWFKNFALSRLGQKLDCIPINLVVDNDICGSTSIRVPVLDNGNATFASVSVDEPGDNIPFEMRQISDPDIFNSFGLRAKNSISRIVQNPLVTKLWPSVLDCIDSQNRLGHSIAAGRHVLESQLGLQTLELPISLLSQTHGFATFLLELIQRRFEFVSIYNRCLLEYRKLHKIRSHSHPVPELETRGQWIELPFWIWHKDNPVRRSLFCRAGGQVELSDGSNIVARLELKRFAEQFQELDSKQICVRPKALTTTMFSRLILSDLFLHGIGGSKYDQMTDAIIQDFFDIAPPQFMTLTATMKLPSDLELVTARDLAANKTRLRELEFHPETLIENPSDETQALIEKKRHWVQTDPPKGQRKERHRAIEESNQELNKILIEKRNKLVANRKRIIEQLQTSQVMGSREFSFCLFPESLPDRLLDLAQ